MKAMEALVSLALIGGVALGQESASCCSAPTQAFAASGSDMTFRMAHLEPEPRGASDKRGQFVSFPTPDGGTGRAYLVTPEETPKIYIFMIHEWWGLNEYIRGEADRLQADFPRVAVLALDLYDGRVAETREAASQFMQEATEGRIRAIIRGALSYVGKDARIGTIGWCFGGGWSLQTAIMAGKQAAACVMYYGMPETDPAKLRDLAAPVLGIFAKKDAWITPEVVAKFQRAMKEAGKDVTVRSYDADHAFANPSNPRFAKEATADAHKLVSEFFRKHLEP